MGRKSTWLAAAVGALALAGAEPSQAAMTGGGLAPVPAAPLVQPIQFLLPDPFNLFFFGGRDWCWYDDGWRGPGWYWCGYGYRHGYGWGGGEGFHGWHEHRYERDWRAHGGRHHHHHDHDY